MHNVLKSAQSSVFNLGLFQFGLFGGGNLNTCNQFYLDHFLSAICSRFFFDKVLTSLKILLECILGHSADAFIQSDSKISPFVRRRKQLYCIAVGTVKMFIEPSAKH